MQTDTLLTAERPRSDAGSAPRYGNATTPRDYRYAHAVFDAFPGEHNPRPEKCLRHWRDHFARYADELKAGIAQWYADREAMTVQPRSPGVAVTGYRTLTDLLWQVADRIYLRGDGYQLMDFNPAGRPGKQTHLRTGLLELGKLLCREVEAERADSRITHQRCDP